VRHVLIGGYAAASRQPVYTAQEVGNPSLQLPEWHPPLLGSRCPAPDFAFDSGDFGQECLNWTPGTLVADGAANETQPKIKIGVEEAD
jgi:hypothetical protein